MPTYGKFTQNEQFVESFTGLGYPVYLSYILAVAYIAGIVAIFQNRFKLLREWGYASFTFAMIGAFLSHCFMNEPQQGLMAIIALVLLLGSYVMEKYINVKNQDNEKNNL